MKRANTKLQQRQREPLYDTDTRTGARIEVFWADPALAKCFGLSSSGWLWWSCRPASLVRGEPRGPFASSYRAFRDALIQFSDAGPFGRRGSVRLDKS